MYATVKTIFNTQIELLRELKEPFQAMEHSTLNEKFNTEPTAVLPANIYPELKYIAIGRGGHRGRISSDGLTIIDIYQHNITHAALYEHIPFIMRKTDNDLSETDRIKYGMRVLVDIAGVEYFAYYLKVINFTNTYPVVEELTILDGETTVIPYVPVAAQLNPTPIPYDNTTANISTGKHISVVSTLELDLNADDIMEIIDAIDIIYGDIGYAVISEIATVTAITQSVNSTLGGQNVTYNEAIAAQCANFIPTNIDLKFTTQAIKHTYSLGHTSPYIR